ncbi:MAG: hypothetical protein HOH66_17555, partial [Rhodospirillaceae bacterium]|nr:hypothetical protein [Rhodospirillaceae bacterium]
MRIRMALAALAVVALSAPTAWAQNLPLKAFFGHYQGNGIAESADSLYFGVTNAGPGDGTADMKVTPWTGG